MRGLSAAVSLQLICTAGIFLSPQAIQAEDLEIIHQGGTVILRSDSVQDLEKHRRAMGLWRRKRGDLTPVEDPEIGEIPGQIIRRFEVNITKLIPSSVQGIVGRYPKCDGANCWNAALVDAKLIEGPRHTHDSEFKELLRTKCRLRPHGENWKPGDIGVIRRPARSAGAYFEDHAFTVIDDGLFFSKNGRKKDSGYLIQRPLDMYAEYRVTDLSCVHPRQIPPSGCHRFVNFYDCTQAQTTEPVEQEMVAASGRSLLRSLMDQQISACMMTGSLTSLRDIQAHYRVVEPSLTAAEAPSYNQTMRELDLEAISQRGRIDESLRVEALRRRIEEDRDLGDSTFLKMLTDEISDRQERAVQARRIALGVFVNDARDNSNANFLPVIASALDDPNREVRALAIDGLKGRLPILVQETITRRIRSGAESEVQSRRELAKILVRMSPPEVSEWDLAMVKLLSDPDPVVQRTVSAQLAVLRRFALSNASSNQRVQAALVQELSPATLNVLAGLQPIDPAVMNVLSQKLQDRELMEPIARALTGLREPIGPEVQAEMIGYLTSNNPVLRRHAAAILKHALEIESPGGFSAAPTPISPSVITYLSATGNGPIQNVFPQECSEEKLRAIVLRLNPNFGVFRVRAPEAN